MHPFADFARGRTTLPAPALVQPGREDAGLDPTMITEHSTSQDHRAPEAPAPTVTVVIPVYRSERFILETLRSALAQTLADLEIVIVDDGSPDHSIDLCRTIRDDRIRYVHQDNAGLAAARNAGIRHAAGRFIAFLDSDDRWAADKLQRHVHHLEARPDLGLSYSFSALIDERGRSLGTYQTLGRPETTAARCFECNPIGNGSNAVIRREVFEELGAKFDEELRQAEDFELWVRIATCTGWRIGCIPRPLTEYRIHSGGLSADVDRQRLFHMKAIDKIERYAPDLVARHRRAAEANLNWYLARHLLSSYRRRNTARTILSAFRLSPRVTRAHNLLLTFSLLTAVVLPQAVHRHLSRLAERIYGRYQIRWIHERQRRWPLQRRGLNFG